MKIKGKARLTLRQGKEILWVREHDNLVVQAGRNLLAALAASEAVDPPGYMACGASATNTTDGMIALQGTEHERVASAPSRSNNTLTFEATFGSGLGSDVTVGEFGIFNDDPAGTMLCRFTSPSFTLEAAATLDVSWQLTMGDTP